MRQATTRIPDVQLGVDASDGEKALAQIRAELALLSRARIGIDIRRVGPTDAPTGIELSISDDGHGFDIGGSSRGGLANIRDRVESVSGTVDIDSEPGRGTTVRAFVPTGLGVG